MLPNLNIAPVLFYCRFFFKEKRIIRKNLEKRHEVFQGTVSLGTLTREDFQVFEFRLVPMTLRHSDLLLTNKTRL